MRAVWPSVFVLAACGGDDVGMGPDGMGPDPNATPKQFCVQETNRYRAMNGKPALTESMQLETFADTGAMVDFNGSPHQHFMSTNGGGIAFAENECPHWNLGQSGGDMKSLVGMCIAAFYSEGPGTDYSTHGHYINMMGPYATLGCGIYMSGSEVTIIQDYGN
jgi:hypothetical protein